MLFLASNGNVCKLLCYEYLDSFKDVTRICHCIEIKLIAMGKLNFENSSINSLTLKKFAVFDTD